MRRSILAGVFLPYLAYAVQERVLLMEKEPEVRSLLKNDYVEVFRISMPADQSSTWPTHAHESVRINLSESRSKSAGRGGKSAPVQVAHAGDVSALSISDRQVTDPITDLGTTAIEAIDIEWLKRPEGAPANPIKPPAAESEGLRAYKWDLAAGASTPVHTHLRPYMIIAGTEMQLSMESPAGGTMEHRINGGDFHWIDSTVTHSLTNKGNAAGVIIEVELK
jgi:mannose-6-phosphate isomerase-like protein (cupin superfamily)